MIGFVLELTRDSSTAVGPAEILGIFEMTEGGLPRFARNDGGLLGEDGDIYYFGGGAVEAIEDYDLDLICAGG